jgi:hypothetical protein
MEFIYIIVGLNVFIVFLFKRAWLLRWKPFLYLLAINSLLFAMGHLFQYYKIGDPRFIAALKIPAPQQLLFIGMLMIYRAIFNRNPEGTWHSMDWKQMKDGIFNFIFWASSTVPIILALDNVI